MRRTLVAMAALGVVAAGCTTPPPTEPPNPFACADTPVDLGPGTVEAISADGEVIVVRTGSGAGDLRYGVIDRRTGERHLITTTSPTGDGAAIHLDDAGTLVYGLRYPALAPGESPWFVHDVASRTTSPFEPGFLGDDYLWSFSGDLRHVVVERPAEPGAQPSPWELVDVVTGERTPLGMGSDPAWRNADFSPDLGLVVQYSAQSSDRRSVRVLDTATGAVVRDLGPVRHESRWYVSTRFVDDETLLVNDAEPIDAPPDGITDDGAFLVDLATGAVTRLDPGVANAFTAWATPDGDRSIFSIIHAQQTWLRRDGVNELLVENFSGTPSDDLSVVVTQEEGRAVLHCF